jgi:Bacteriophage protein of unknown function (DUF646).
MARQEHMRVVVKGLAEAIRALKAAPDDVRRALPRALREAAAPAKADAAARAPRRDQTLAGSIRLRANQKGAQVGSALPYAGVLEFAHRGKYASLSQRWGPPPRFLIPAVEGRAAEIEARIGRDVQAVLDRAFPEGR